jgi:thermosome
MTNEKQPMIILPENVQRMIGRDAQRNNILAARIVAETVKTTLGPKGMDKMLVNGMGDITVTNDGVTILEEMEIEHPAAKMMVEIAKTQESEVGDGTTTAVILAGKLLENAEILLDKKIHPTVIAKGYRIAAEKANDFLKEISIKISNKDDNLLKQIAMTAMTGKGAETAKEKFADIIVKSVKQVAENNKVDLNNIKLVKLKGKGIENTELISGFVLDKERANNEMPERVKDAKIGLLDCAIELRNPEGDTKINISSPDQIQSFIEQEEKIIKGMVSKIKNSGANVIFCQKGIDDTAQYYLGKEKIFAVRRVNKSDLEKLSRATGAKIVSNLNELSGKELGMAGEVAEEKEGNEAMIYVRGCKSPRALTILIRGGTSHVIDEMEKAIKDGLGDVSAAIEIGKFVAGAGACEVELAKRLRDFSQGLSGREQLAVEKFAESLESIPITLAENGGLDPIDVITELKAKHDKGEKNFGINIFNNKVEDVLKAGIIEPLKIKTQAIASASEVAMMILRIDDVIASGPGNSGSGRSMPNMAGLE